MVRRMTYTVWNSLVSFSFGMKELLSCLVPKKKPHLINRGGELGYVCKNCGLSSGRPDSINFDGPCSKWEK